MKAILQCLILGGILALAACAKDNGSSPAPATAVVTANGCTADQIPTNAGCGTYAAQCGPSAGLVNGVCQPAIAQACGVATPGVAANPYGCQNGYNQGYNGYNNGYAYQGGGYAYSAGYAVQPQAVFYNRTTQTFDSNYYATAPYGNPYGYGYGYRPYYPAQNGVSVGANISFSF
jgi:hypothetical protein